MKAIVCKRCEDMVALGSLPRWCGCRASGGRYTGDDAPDTDVENDAIYWGEAVPLGFVNRELNAAVRAHGGEFRGKVFEPNAPTFRRVTLDRDGRVVT